MTHVSPRILLLIAATALAACSSSSGGSRMDAPNESPGPGPGPSPNQGPGDGPDGGPNQSPDEVPNYDAELSDLLDFVRQRDFTDPASLPTSGSATYNGVLVAETPQYGVTGDMLLAADFEDDSISGRFNQFVDSDDRPVAGRLVLENGAINRDVDIVNEYTFGADVAGRLRDADGDVLDVDAQIDGDFGGRNYRAVGGDIFGTATENGGEASIVQGFFLGRR